MDCLMRILLTFSVLVTGTRAYDYTFLCTRAHMEPLQEEEDKVFVSLTQTLGLCLQTVYSLAGHPLKHCPHHQFCIKSFYAKFFNSRATGVCCRLKGITDGQVPVVPRDYILIDGPLGRPCGRYEECIPYATKFICTAPENAAVLAAGMRRASGAHFELRHEINRTVQLPKFCMIPP